MISVIMYFRLIQGCYTKLVDWTELTSIILFCSAGALLALQVTLY